MKLKKRPTENPPVCGSGPLETDLSSRRTYRPGESVSVQPEATGLHSDLNAQVLGMSGDKLRVRALHAFYLTGTERLVERGAEFEVAHDEVFLVNVP